MVRISSDKEKKTPKPKDIAKIKLGYEEDLHKIKIALFFLAAINIVHLFSFLYQYLFPMSSPPLEELIVVLYILVVFDILCVIPYIILFYKYKQL